MTEANWKNQNLIGIWGKILGKNFPHNELDYLLHIIIIYHNMQCKQFKIEKCRKTQEFWAKLIKKMPNFFSSKIGRCQFSRLTIAQLEAKKLRNPMVGSMLILNH